MITLARVALLFVVTIIVVPDAALAYGGPGSVVSGIGAFLAAVAALFATLFGFIWFPLKRLYKRITNEETRTEETAANQPSE